MAVVVHGLGLLDEHMYVFPRRDLTTSARLRPRVTFGSVTLGILGNKLVNEGLRGPDVVFLNFLPVIP